MGSGSSSSRSTNNITVQPMSTNHTEFSSATPRFDSSPPQNNSISTSNTNVDVPFVPLNQIDSNFNGQGLLHQENLSTLSNEVESDDSIERAVVPQTSSGGHTKSRRHSNGKQKKNKNHRDFIETLTEELGDKDDGIVFEVYRSYDGGVEYTVINTDGVRFYIDSWSTGEWKPFPEEWINCGHIEKQRRLNNDNPEDCVSGNITIDNTLPGVGMDDNERMGVIHHPLKGDIITYIMDEQRHVNCLFDPSSGAWLKIPLSWELQSTFIATVVAQIQNILPDWINQYEVLAMLRQCNYNSDETITTFLTLLEDDSTWQEENKVFVKTPKNNTLRANISELENIIRNKNIEIVENQQKRKELQEKLSYSESLICSLQNKVNGLQRDLEQTQKELKNNRYLRTKTPSPQLVHTPKKREVEAEVILAVTKSIKSLVKCTQQFKNEFAKDSNNFQALLDKALWGIRQLSSRKQANESEINELRRLYNREALHRKLLYNKLQELQGNIRVFCRCRYDPGADVAFKFPSDQEIQTKSQMGEKTFLFDRVFDPYSSQQQVFDDTLPLIKSCVDGYSVCIMAYGQTGSGKTYTMMGMESDPGVNMRSIQELFHICKEKENVDYSLTVSMLEVYNETLRDLLADDNRPNQLNIQMKGRTVVVNDLTEIQVNNEGTISKIMEKGNANRSVGETKMNTNSSRSHLALILNVKGVDQISNSVSHGMLTLVDLAGSERISKTEATGQRLIEAAAINKSLSALGQVFIALRTNAMHVPYRNSKLTQLLQASLGGDGKACLFVNISPAHSNLRETLSTLNFGSAAKQVQLGKPIQNVKKVVNK